jgi:pSer/pThr/pTyr-binding forkhead associated (FHA) protein
MRIALGADETLIGRGAAGDVTLSDDGVSREHVLLGFDETAGAWTIEDLQSTNGTRVNGKRVRSSVLQPGDELQIGSTRLTFLLL